MAAQKKGFFLCFFLQILGEVCTRPYVSSRQCVRVICSKLLPNPCQNLNYQHIFFRLLPGPRHGSLAFMLAAEIGLFLTSEGDYFDSPKTRYNYKCHKMFRATTCGLATSAATTRAASTSTLIPMSTRTTGSSPGMRWPSRSSYWNIYIRSLYSMMAFWFFWNETFKDTFPFYTIYRVFF